MACSHPLRSVLYTTADNERGLEKLGSLGADAFILDLEDGVPDDRKEDARKILRGFLEKQRLENKYLTVRVNAVSSRHVADDLRAIAGNPPRAVVFPKVSGKEDAAKAETLMKKAGLPAWVKMWCLVETPKGVLNAPEIAGGSSRLEVLVVGTSDLSKDLHVPHSAAREGLLHSLSRVVLAARACGLSAIDGVFINLRDFDGFERTCRQGRALGFDGKTVIHPIQIKPANKIFGPGEAEIAEARRIISAFEAAQKKGKGVVLVGGKLVENLDVENARRVLALAEKTARKA